METLYTSVFTRCSQVRCLAIWVECNIWWLAHRLWHSKPPKTIAHIDTSYRSVPSPLLSTLNTLYCTRIVSTVHATLNVYPGLISIKSPTFSSASVELPERLPPPLLARHQPSLPALSWYWRQHQQEEAQKDLQGDLLVVHLQGWAVYRQLCWPGAHCSITVLEQVHPVTGILNKGMAILNSLVNNIFERIAPDATGMFSFVRRTFGHVRKNASGKFAHLW